MHMFYKYLLVFIISIVALNASQASTRLILFTQADGTKFEGFLKGDSAFHWIESNNKVVMYNKKDKFYYIARLNNNVFELTNEKPKIENTKGLGQVSGVMRSKKSSHFVDSNTKKALQILQRESRKGYRPR